MIPYLEMDAAMSDDGLYRYWLSRRLSAGDRTILFVGLNPSTADGRADDPTIRRMAGFARAWGYNWLMVGNVNAWRSPDPTQLPADPLTAVGLPNVEVLTWMAQRAEVVVAAWGRHPLNSYAAMLAAWIMALPHAQCLGCNANGTPRHPLYLPATTRLEVVIAHGPRDASSRG